MCILMVEMAGIMKYLPVFHPFGAVQKAHVKIRSRRIFEPVSGLNSTLAPPNKKTTARVVLLFGGDGGIIRHLLCLTPAGPRIRRAFKIVPDDFSEP